MEVKAAGIGKLRAPLDKGGIQGFEFEGGKKGVMMDEEGFANELKEVRSAEAEKAKVLAQAEKEAKSIISKAEAEAEKIIGRAQAQAREAEDKIIGAARKEAEEEEKKILAKAGHEAERMQGMMVTESVVKMGLKKLIG